MLSHVWYTTFISVGTTCVECNHLLISNLKKKTSSRMEFKQHWLNRKDTK